MVHALEEIRRALVPGGILIDLRPRGGDWPVELSAREAVRPIGRVRALPEGVADDEAADAAMAEAARRGWFAAEGREEFPLFYYWNTPGEMMEFVAEEWTDFIEIGEPVWKELRAAWAVAEADARPRVRAQMILSRWRKSD